MTTILLIGKSGQLGCELLHALTPLGRVAAPGREEIDLARPETITACVRALAPQLIVNAAAYTAVDQAETEEEIARSVNATAPGILAEEAERLGVPLVHYSTDYVFDGSKPEPYTERDAPNPLNVYGKTKLEGERAIQAAGAHYLIFRTSWVYGARRKNFLLTMLRLAAEKETLQVVDDQIGAPSWSGDLARGTAQVLARLMGDRPEAAFDEVSGLYHLTSAGETSWYGFAQAILEGAPGRERHRLRELAPISTAQYPTPAKRPANSRLDNSAVGETFGVRMPHWRESLARVLAE